ncbi:hypothetical protein PROFUN_11161 [Planoprotostelium fungivorum]|uniref:Uncharacterized protein n=1 Tax=Planoprotostelium fungivorum TaxID=1890364 RepID=A0A2P6NAP1_9EUKA|nr:hypothetical protein PROFUN_11161 [Planoprotostelium fungivorum]
MQDQQGPTVDRSFKDDSQARSYEYCGTEAVSAEGTSAFDSNQAFAPCFPFLLNDSPPVNVISSLKWIMIARVTVLFFLLRVGFTVANCSPCGSYQSIGSTTYYCNGCTGSMNINNNQCSCGDGSRCLTCSEGGGTTGGGGNVSPTCSYSGLTAYPNPFTSRSMTNITSLDLRGGVTGYVYIDGADDSFTAYWMDAKNSNTFISGGSPWTYYVSPSVTSKVKCYSVPNLNIGATQGLALGLECGNIFQSCNSLSWNYYLMDAYGNIAARDYNQRAPTTRAVTTYNPTFNPTTNNAPPTFIQGPETVVVGTAGTVLSNLALVAVIALALWM